MFPGDTGEKSDSVVEVRPLFVTSAIQPWGAEQSLAMIINGLSSLGARSLVLCSSPAVADFLSAETDAEIALFTAPENRFLRLLAFARRLIQHGKGRTAVVVFSVNLYYLGWVLRFVPIWRPKVIADVHDSFLSPRALRIVSSAVSGFHRVIYISNYVGTMLPPKIDRRLVVRPIELSRHFASDGQLSSLVVGIAGRLDAEKRIELAIESVGLCPPLLSLNIYGSAFSGHESYQQVLEELGEHHLPDRVSFKGRVPSSQIYKEIDILFVANSQEASGRTVGEAMAAGVPVVVPSKGGAQEFVEHMSSGLVYEAESAVSASRAISQLACSQELRSKISDNARAKIQAERSTLRVAQLYLEALTD